MQHMPDKEFDKLFKDRFEDAEIMPSANLWANIEKELEPKKKRTLPIYWMAAASIAVLITVMLVFQKKEVIQLRGAAETVNVKPNVVEQPNDLPSEDMLSGGPIQKMAAKNQVSPAIETPKKAIMKVKEDISEKDQLALQPSSNNNRLPIKQQDPKPIDVLPIKEVPVENNVSIALLPVNDKIESGEISEAGNIERKGIRNVGDLVNYVVDKVDKRDKKLVRFETDDDDNSSIIGINIGFLRLNKKNKDK
jgi:hypothetical protein